jgi:hypothetical protein
LVRQDTRRRQTKHKNTTQKQKKIATQTPPKKGKERGLNGRNAHRDLKRKIARRFGHRNSKGEESGAKCNECTKGDNLSNTRKCKISGYEN